MAVAWGQRHSRRHGHRNASSFPVLHWLQVGAATAGVGMALVAAPAAAQADTGSTTSSSDSSQGAGPSAAADTSPSAGSSGAGADVDDNSGNDAIGNASSSSDQETATGPRNEASEEAPDEGDAISPESDPVPDDDALEQLAEDATAPADLTDTDLEEVEEDTSAEVGTNGQETGRSRSADSSSEDSSFVDDGGSSGDDGIDDDSAEATPEIPATDFGPDSAIEPLVAQEQSPPAMMSITTEPASSVAESQAASSDRPAYPAHVDAPVTWRAIVTETLNLLGADVGPNLPFTNDPVPDLLAGLWIGMRRLQYTLFNSAPELQPDASTEDGDTGLITGDLQATDADGDVITYSVTSAPTHGTVLIADNGTYTYTPDADFTGGTDVFTVAAMDTGPSNPWHFRPADGLRSGLSQLLTGLGFQALPDASTATVTVQASAKAPVAPSITLHNNSGKKLWVYNLETSGDYSIKAPFSPVEVANGHSTKVTLAAGTGALGSPENRIYIVEGDKGFTIPVEAQSGVDAFNPTAATAENSFLNYNFLEYFLYSADGGSQYTIDTSYIDEWSLPVQYKFTIPHDAAWTGAQSGKTYGFSDYDTVVNQLKAAEKAGKGPYSDLIWKGSTPFGPQPPATVNRIIGPNKVWTAQSLQPPTNVNMNHAGWVPTSYQDFVQYGATKNPNTKVTTYPYAQDGTKYSDHGNFTFWKDSVNGPASTPYPMALRTAAIHDGFPAADGVYGFFTYPNDETAGQFTNIPSSVSLDIYVHGSSDGASDSVIEGGSWFYTSPESQSGSTTSKHGRDVITGTGATDTFILDSVFNFKRKAPLVVSESEEGDIVVIDQSGLGATSYDIDVVDCFWFLGGGLANYDSQFIYDRSSGYLYYDEDPGRFGYTGVLAKLDPASKLYVL